MLYHALMGHRDPPDQLTKFFFFVVLIFSQFNPAKIFRRISDNYEHMEVYQKCLFCHSHLRIKWSFEVLLLF